MESDPAREPGRTKVIQLGEFGELSCTLEELEELMDKEVTSAFDFPAGEVSMGEEGTDPAPAAILDEFDF